MKLKNKFLALGLVLAFTFTACDNEALLDLNNNPNAATEIDMSYLFAYSILETSGGRYENWRAMLIYSSTMIQHYSTLATYWSGDKYLYNAGYSSSLWDRYYPSCVKNITEVVDNTDAATQPNLNAMARILRVFMMHRITDMYGDAPYFQAGRALADEANWFPAYDSQEDIYNDMIAELQAASAQLDANADAVGAQDLLFGGDVTLWEKWANSLLLRMGLRVADVDGGLASTAISAALSGPLMTSNADNAYVVHTDGPEGINRNGIGEVFLVDDQPRLSESWVDRMIAMGDPRLDLLSFVASGGPHLGMPNGNDVSTIDSAPNYPGDTDGYSRPSDLFTGTDDPMVFQFYSEVEFMLAEVAERGLGATPMTAAQHYEAGITAAMTQWDIFDASLTVDPADIATYIAANPYGGLEDIGIEYYNATYPNEYETYSNWRRTGFPTLTPTNYPGNETNGQIPRRLIYPGGEASSNPDSFNNALSAQGIGNDNNSRFMTPVWWDN